MRFAPSRTLVTGASSGIGAAFARALAARGSDLVLVARRADRLDALAAELRQESGIDAAALALDLGAVGAADALRDQLADSRPIEAVINCAGFGTHGRFADEEGERIREELQVNVGAVVALTHAFLPTMLQQQRGAIVNVASLFAYQPSPNMAVYGATKSFILHFTEALWHETRKTGVKVLVVSPGPTRTEFFDAIEGFGDVPTRVFQTPEQVVTTTLRALDRRNSPPSITSGGLANVLPRITRLVPRHVAIRIGALFT